MKLLLPEMKLAVADSLAVWNRLASQVGVIHPRTLYSLVVEIARDTSVGVQTWNVTRPALLWMGISDGMVALTLTEL